MPAHPGTSIPEQHLDPTFAGWSGRTTPPLPAFDRRARELRHRAFRRALAVREVVAAAQRQPALAGFPRIADGVIRLQALAFVGAQERILAPHEILAALARQA